jgi:hypothetical protein
MLFFGESMKRSILAFALFATFAVNLHAQNLTTVSATNITDINGTKLAAGQLCFLITDQQDNPISVSIGGGGQALKRGYCSPVTIGAVTPTFTVPNPASTLPSGIYYRVTVKDSSTGQEVLRYTGVTFTGATFNFDNYAPVNLGSFAPLSGNSVSGNLAVSGNIAATGTITGSNIPSSILQQIFNAGVGLTQRTAFNCLAGIVCSDNTAASRTDVRLGSLTTVAFSATPTFDASTAASFKLTLTGNVTSSTLSNAVAGEPISFEICQDATGGRTFVPPVNVLNMGTIVSTASACSTQEFWFDGSNAVSAGPMQSSGGSIIPGTLSVAGTSTLGNVNMGAANTLGVATIKQVSPTTGFNISDNLGASHFFISNSSPYLNTFVQGNGSGSVFLGTANKAFVADTTGTITTAGGVALQTTSQTLPASITNDTAGGILFTNNAGSSMQLGNGGTLFLNSPQGIRWTGATSGTTVVQASSVAGAGILTLPATVTDTLVARTTTDTLTNKTLTSPAISDPAITGNTNVKRIKANQGSALVVGDVGGLTAAWGSTASVSSVVGNDVIGQISILSNGTGQNINAGFTLTFHDGTWTTPPVCLAVRGDGFAPQGIMIANAATATNVSFFFNAVPVAGTTYTLTFICIGR